MEIRKKDISDVLSGLPRAVPFEPTACHVDVLFATLGFEDRTHAVIDSMFHEGIETSVVLVLITYPTNEEDNKKNLIHFEKYRRHIKAFVEIKYSRASFQAEVAKTVRDFCNVDSSVLLDISTTSSYVFYPLFHELLKSDINLKVVYTEAVEYFPSQEEWKGVEESAKVERTLFTSVFEQANFLSVGVDDVYSLNLFSEMNPGNRPSAIVLLPSFSAIRINSIRAKDQDLNKTSNLNTYWLIGSPPAEKNKWRIEAVKKTNSVELSHPDHIKYVSTLDYTDATMQLEHIWLDIKYDSYLSIGTLGSKMQHLGTYLFLYMHQDIGIWVSEPTQFKAKSYTSGIGQAWEVNFASTSKILKVLDDYQQFEWFF